MRDRQLLRTATSSASVVGLVPESLLNINNSNPSDSVPNENDNDNNSTNESCPSIPSSSSGRIDVSSGLAYLIVPPSPPPSSSPPSSPLLPNANHHILTNNTFTTAPTLYLWRHETYTLAEEIIPHESNAVVQLTHPRSSPPIPTTTNTIHERLIALVPTMMTPPPPPPSPSPTTVSPAITTPMVPPGSTSLYWCSPDGILCYWNDLASLIPTHPLHHHLHSTYRAYDCDVSTALPLLSNESVTAIFHTHGSSNASGGRGGGTQEDGDVAPYDDYYGGALFIGTSACRTFIITKNTRPLELTVRLFSSSASKSKKRKDAAAGAGGGGGSGSGSGGTVEGDDVSSFLSSTTTTAGGLIGGIYNKIFTPSAKKRRSLSPSRRSSSISRRRSSVTTVKMGMMDSDKKLIVEGGVDRGDDCDDIVGIFTFRNRDGAVTGGGGKGRRGSSMLDRRRRAVAGAGGGGGDSTLVYTVSSGGTVDTWSAPSTTSPTPPPQSPSTPPPPGLGKHRHTLSLTTAMTQILDDDTTVRGTNRPTISTLQVLQSTLDNATTPAFADDRVSSIVCCIRIVYCNEVGMKRNGRMYMVRCPIDPFDGSVMMGQALWLSRYSNKAIIQNTGGAFGSGSLGCAGIITRTEPYNSVSSTENDGLYTTTVYSVFQSNPPTPDEDYVGNDDVTVPTSPSRSRLNVSHPVTISTIRFLTDHSIPSASTRNLLASSPSSSTTTTPSPRQSIQTDDIDLPNDVIPSAIPSTISHDSTTDGCVFVGSTGCVVAVRLTFPAVTFPNIVTTGSLRRLMQNVDDRDEGVVKGERKEMAEVLASHLLGAFRGFVRRRREMRMERSMMSPVGGGGGGRARMRRKSSLGFGSPGFGSPVGGGGVGGGAGVGGGGGSSEEFLDSSSLPQSLYAADNELLTHAVGIASEHIINERYSNDKESGGSSGGGSGAVTTGHTSSDPTDSNTTPTASNTNAPSVAKFTYGAASARILLRDKISSHSTYLNFLIRAGIYRRVVSRGRMVLRDHGEMLHAVGGLLDMWQEELELRRRRRRREEKEMEMEEEDEDGGGGDGEEEGDMTNGEVEMVQLGLVGIEEVITDFPEVFRTLQKNILLVDSHDGEDDDDDDTTMTHRKTSTAMIYQMCNLSSKCMEYALGYRRDQSEITYDLSASPPNPLRGWGSSGCCYPWTSQDDILAMLEDSMKALQTLMDDPVELRILERMVSSEEEDGGGGGEGFGSAVCRMACNLLDGYRDITPSKRNEGRYDKAKELAVSLVQQISPHRSSTDGSGAGDESKMDTAAGYDDAEDNLAFQLSLDHGYFQGVVEICHAHYDPLSPAAHHLIDQPYSPYDIGPMLSHNTTSDSYDINNDRYANLYARRDYNTNLTFPKFVFRWYTDRNMTSRVLELGGYCPEILSECMEEDERLSDLRWVQHIKTGNYDQSSKSLMSLVNNGINPLGGSGGSGKGDGNRTIPSLSMEERQLVLSLARLSNLIHPLSGGGSNTDPSRKIIVDKNLQLCKAQEILAEFSDEPQEALRMAMSADELIAMTTAAIDRLEEATDISRACCAGLSVVEVIDAEGRSAEAGKIWSKVIDIDKETWVGMTEQWNGMADDERIVMVQDTAFFHLARDYYGQLDYGSSIDTVGFKNPQVQKKALGLLRLSQSIDEIFENVLFLI